MKDNQLRGLILRNYYENRRAKIPYLPGPEDFNPRIEQDDILAIADQLGQHGLLEWIPVKTMGEGLINGFGKINAFGIDVVEGEATPDIKVDFVQNNVTITGSSGVIVGDHNTQTIANHISEIAKAIDSADATPEEKEQAKGLLRTVLEHPLVSTLVGAAAGKLLG